ncbi:SDR family oxidoreductase [Nitratireductor aquimarinus]|uniref:SDR family oxidoreductase n=1 Tax=Nitratireductor aquimarinus TaxID=889300 RepID=A0ABU4AI28_9HYPH|nr:MULTISPECIES: SDR family oxidoreductase [Alphaproteobacteria]MBY6021934.1 SDR family oxidoreductase [Nitratireductor sp. DP7N14-4]MBN7757147.1 SDR family oxidoreductase [Nitratireductor aquimarinus]MBN7761089.1 SDR family oxidoreductase [Nitratireductor aquibiodomus]MBN7777315.1 SDR family oxidoreductase [Nitratireductor pacificus]MBN7780986.1 SDR family oxidoreductase [Nitratireductor pacificus]
MALDGKTAIVTGGASGIGYAIAERFLRHGVKVVIADVDGEKGAQALSDLEKLGDARFVKADVSKRLDVHNMLAETIDAFGDVDILVNNAGIVHASDFLDLSEEDFSRVLDINLKGSFLAGQAVARFMVEKVQNGGAPGTIINMSSINAVLAIPEQIAYSVSKGGVNQLTRVMALALAPYGIRVNAIGPGSIMTEMLAKVNSDQAARNRMLSRTPLGRAGEPGEIASVATFLADDDASYVTGQTIYADGGRLPLNYTVEVKPDIS